MRFPTIFLLLILSVWNPLCSASDLPTLSSPLADINVAQNAVVPAVDLTTKFTTGITGSVVQFVTRGIGTFNVEMDSVAAPATVANFLYYANANRYTNNSIIHRTDTPLGVIQGGGYSIDTVNSQLTTIATTSAISLEMSDTLENKRGYLAMANGGSPNTTTNQWFINVTDNSTPGNSHYLPSASNSGYAVFGRVTGTGMEVVDFIFSRQVPGGNVIVTQSSMSSTAVTVNPASVPSHFGPGWELLGSTVQSVGSGGSVTLAGNANENIGVPLFRPFSPYLFPLNQLPVFNPIPAIPTSPIYLSNLISLSAIQQVQVFPTTLSVTVTNCSTSNNSVQVSSPPPAFGIGSSFLGSIVTSVNGNFVSLQRNADRTIPNGSSTPVPAGVAFESSVVTFSVINTNPDLAVASISGSMFNVALRPDRGGFADITVTATDSNGNSAQSKFHLTVTAGTIATSIPKDANNDGIADLVFQNNAGQLYEWFLDGSGSGVDFTTQNGLKPGSKYLYGGALGDWRLMARADMNNDGFPDLIFQNSAGQIYVWFLDGSGNPIDFSNGNGLKPGSKYLYGGGLGDWRLVAVADVNGDGIADLVFQNSAGQIYVWFLNGTGDDVDFSTGRGLITTGPAGSKYLYSGGLGDWRIAAAADVNGDGMTDFVFQNSAGQIYIWFLDGTGDDVDFSTGSGMQIPSRFLYGGALGDWRIR
ncbi:MAG: peptidylprolyl isomerase [Chthoniobacteraceae bacterium]